MRRYFYDPPKLVKFLFKDFTWNSKSGKILLTFDDGPHPDITPTILNELNKLDVKAVFFCVGNNIAKNYKLAEDILSEGHLIGNHTFNHKKVADDNKKEIKNEITSFNNLYEEYFGLLPQLFRPPYGKINFNLRKLLRELNMQCVLWSLLTYDFENNMKKVKFSVDKYLRKDSIVVLHDNKKSKEIIVDSIHYIRDTAYKKGYQIGKPEECLM